MDAMISLLVMVFYLAIIAFIIWFAITLITTNKERNRLLKEISNKLDGPGHGGGSNF
ncbi:hypothetical protein ACFO3D_18190 [Virgibacillus kekensis]|uniref:CcmD family protein n=1 Tax=Virgibacillus kekensis TaxID=202261 RepID=A0ABV9DN74_9BACI